MKEKKKFIQIKKNRIDLFELKNLNEMMLVEKKFNLFLNKKIFTKKNNKYLYKNKKCACGNIIGKKNNKFYIKPFAYIECKKCNSISVDPMINDKGLDLIYSNNGAYSIYRKKFLENKKKKYLRNNIINNRKVSQVLSLFKNNKFSILDFGCGDGGFLKFIKKKGVRRLFGVDSKFISSKSENGIFYSKNLDGLKRKFDCITLWGVIEHLNKPLDFLNYILKYLKKGGFLVMEFPNSNCLLMDFIKKNKFSAPRYLEQGRHLFFFSQKFITIMCKKERLDLNAIETNGLDVQTILGEQKKINLNKIFSLQETIDQNLLSDHFRVALKKK